MTVRVRHSRWWDTLNELIENGERVLVTLLRSFGPWKDSVYLVGRLTPSYLIRMKPPYVLSRPETGHVGTTIELQILADVEAYRSLEDNFRKLGFERGENANGERVSWRWQVKTESGATLVLEFLVGHPGAGGSKTQPPLTLGNISALSIPYSSIIYDHYEVKEVSAALLGDDSVVTETIRHTDIVSFVCLRSYVLDQRHEDKDAYSLIHCLRSFKGGPEAVAKALRAALDSRHKEAVETALQILRRRFGDEEKSEGYLKDGPIAAAKFELSGHTGTPEARLTLQRRSADLITHLLREIRA